MRRIIFASHHKFAFGLKETIKYILNDNQKVTNIYEISAYVENNYHLNNEVEMIFQSFDPSDEVVILTDILYGSVNQAFMPYISDHCHLITGVNVPLALELILYPEDVPLDKHAVDEMVKACAEQVVYMNTYQVDSSENDE